ncbi:MAG: 16S rRNA (uracil(1498)-N(3))-methyltransferase [Tannerella sp.]|jgi:16S rRNA (uracil1498-N3)-methyltransferase|nr:16S rRNA (uracil(1498)-N(3))-methyltransferase [Tannerella sp.]
MKPLFYAPDMATRHELPEEESQHCTRVLRLKEGDEITVTDGKGHLYTAILTDIHPKHCSVEIAREQATEPFGNFRIHIAVAPAKQADRMEWFVEKATEIGISEITCLRCRYSERREMKLQRLHKIAVSAMKQSQQTRLPQIHEMTDFEDFITLRFEGCKMFGHCREEGPKQPVREIYRPGTNALLLIGPEGDFSSGEINAALEAGFLAVSLGKNRLRTETAALVACHTIHVLNR